MNSDHREAESARKGGLSPASPQDRDLRTDASDDRFDIGHHVCHIEPKHAIPRAYQGPIAPLIEPLASTVVEPIDFDDELHRIRSTNRVPELAGGIAYDCVAWRKGHERRGRHGCSVGVRAG